MHIKFHTLLLGTLLFSLSSSLKAQDNTLSTKDYAKAESRLLYSTEPLVDHSSIRPNWFNNDLFIYKSLRADGYEFILVNPSKGIRLPLFDHDKVASQLSELLGQTYSAYKLPIPVSYTHLTLPTIYSV